MPENAVRGIEPVRLMNQFGHIINVVEDDDVDASIESHSDEKAHSNNDNDESTVSIPMMSRDGRMMFLIR